MELSGIELQYIVRQIASKAANSGYYVSNVSTITRSSLLLRLHHPTQEDIMLVLSTKGIWITRLKFKPIEANTALEESARAEIERAKLESIEQAGSERIVSLKFRHPDGRIRIIVVEFFGEGNLVICDEAMQILSILNRIEVRHRTLAPGLRYAFPPIRGVDVFDLSMDKLALLKNEAKNLDVLRWIGRGVSMPKKFVEEIAVRSDVDPSKTAADLTNDELARIYHAISELVTDVSTGRNHVPIIIEDNQSNRPVDALPILTEVARKLSFKQVESFMDAVDQVLSAEILDLGRSSKTVEIDRQIALFEHDLDEQNKAKEALAEKSNEIRRLASELMTLSYSGLDKSDSDKAKIDETLASCSAQIITEKGIKYVDVSGERVPLEDNLAKTSSKLFARAKELERGSASIDQARIKLIEQIAKLRNKTEAIHRKVVVQQQTSKEWYERYRWFITTDGLMAIGGRDASSNSALIRKHLTENDIVFHAEVHGSPFFIVKNAAGPAIEGKIEASLVQAAQATVGFSRAWKDGLTSADAYWVTPEQIKKGAPTGQFLPKGSFVIEGKRNYLKGVEIRLAIGLFQNDGRLSLICGPESAIKPKALFYAVLLQGGMDPMNASKKLKSQFISLASNAKQDESNGLEDVIKQMSLDEFIRSLPNGQSRVAFAARGQGQAPAATLSADHKK